MQYQTSKFTLLPFLKTGDKIGVTCPAGAVNMEEMQDMFATLRSWGFEVVVGKTVGTQYYKFSASDDERYIELQEMLDDDSIKAICFGRGGYGLVRIIDRLDFTQFKQSPKWLVGYSDITCLHSHVNSQFGISTLHAHMGAGYKPENYDATSTQSIYNALMGNAIGFDIEPHNMNRTGGAEGILCGGNLALLSDLIGTPSDIDTQGKILVIEDIAEYKYNIDRMMWQLLRAGKLTHLAGLVVGAFTDTQDNEIPFGMSEYEIVWEKIKDFDYPVAFGCKVGHQSENYALKLGSLYRLEVGSDSVSLIDRSIFGMKS
ncbi:MAG: LD-carboxypeptidase [Bacteroidetes bacterium]|nr:LD-carboxypeptidase [Bacteroidota bacterium]